MMRIYCILLVTLMCFSAGGQVAIEEVSLMNRLHYRVVTANAICFVDRYSGGISRLFDADGIDWVDWKRLEAEKYPESAAGDYRGIPNLVYGGEDNGIGHPGFDRCMSFREGLNRIRVRSLNGRWEFLYVFYPNYIELQIIRTPENGRKYWFLYEGVPGGKFAPEQTYWGSNLGFINELPDYFKGEALSGNWQWVFFGNRQQNRVFFLVQKGQDQEQDLAGFLGNSEKGTGSGDGMVVFGFGRGPEATPLLSFSNTFYFGFYDKKVNEKNFKNLEKFIRKTFIDPQ